MVPSINETLGHPAFPGAIWPLEPAAYGRVNVAKPSRKPIRIAWEIHGMGPIKMVFIMGLSAIMSTWQRQTFYFGHERGDRYSVLVLDNRGAGMSDCPIGLYTTRKMARDIITVLDHIGWKDNRELNVVGFSLGGMIAQELACAIPWRIQTLSLLSTTSRTRGEALTPRQLVKWITLLCPTTKHRRICNAADVAFSTGWLVGPDNEVLPSTISTPRYGRPNGADYGRFDSNFQRFQAEELTKLRESGPPSSRGFFLQMLAALCHRKSNAQLGTMADAVGRDRILVLHGIEDGAIRVQNGRMLIDAIQPRDGIVEAGLGHTCVVERPAWVNRLLEMKASPNCREKA